jgi:hypothetical protein
MMAYMLLQSILQLRRQLRCTIMYSYVKRHGLRLLLWVLVLLATHYM